jgi:hypothetical protein
VLRRQEPSETSHEQTKVTPEDIKNPAEWIPAISDAGGPEPRPYSFDMKPEEEAGFLKKMLAIAGQEVSARASASGQGAEPKSKAADRNVRSTWDTARDTHGTLSRNGKVGAIFVVFGSVRVTS